MKLDVELISEMMIFGAPSGAGRVRSGTRITLLGAAGDWFCGVRGDFGAGWSRSGAGITLVGVAGGVLEEFEDGDPTHTQNLESRSHRPRAWCVCVCVGGCGGGAPYPIGGADLSSTAPCVRGFF